jgi:hypothetical protein
MEFAQECQRWRDWARSAVGGSAAQVAAAGDAAALTGVLGGVDVNDLIAAAKAAAGRFLEASASDRVASPEPIVDI